MFDHLVAILVKPFSFIYLVLLKMHNSPENYRATIACHNISIILLNRNVMCGSTWITCCRVQNFAAFSRRCNLRDLKRIVVDTFVLYHYCLINIHGQIPKNVVLSLLFLFLVVFTHRRIRN